MGCWPGYVFSSQGSRGSRWPYLFIVVVPLHHKMLQALGLRIMVEMKMISSVHKSINPFLFVEAQPNHGLPRSGFWTPPRAEGWVVIQRICERLSKRGGR
jgi:hypothetical protein